jgi:hypothetical protein
MPRSPPSLSKIISESSDMAHLAAGAHLLAVQLDAEPLVSGETVQQR